MAERQRLAVAVTTPAVKPGGTGAKETAAQAVASVAPVQRQQPPV